MNRIAELARLSIPFMGFVHSNLKTMGEHPMWDLSIPFMGFTAIGAQTAVISILTIYTFNSIYGIQAPVKAVETLFEEEWWTFNSIYGILHQRV